MGFESFLIAEEKLFSDYKHKFPELKDEDIWKDVYNDINQEIDLETERSKRESSRSGCNSIFLFGLLLLLIIGAVL